MRLLKEKARDIRLVISDYWKQFSVQYKIARDSLEAANKRFEEDERAGKIPKLNLDVDVDECNEGKTVSGGGGNYGISQRELRRRRWRRKLEYYVDSLQETISAATKTLNDITGYSKIQDLRNRITVLESELAKVKTDVKMCKVAYETAVEMRTKSQREVNELLQRKHVWTPEDLARFTKLYKDDASNLKKEQELKQRLSDLENLEDKASNELYKAILIRYHEEQIWSDKIRRTSTWGTFILTVVNTCFFLVLQFLLEPYKRWRLTRAFENKVKLALEEYSLEQEGQVKEMEHTEEALKQDIELEIQPKLSQDVSEVSIEETLRSEPIELSTEVQAEHLGVDVEEKTETSSDGGTVSELKLEPELDTGTMNMLTSSDGNDTNNDDSTTIDTTADSRSGIFNVLHSIQNLWHVFTATVTSLSKKLKEPRSIFASETITLTSGELTLYSLLLFVTGSLFSLIV